jgi:metallo-beta-lactamase family protein
LAEAIVEGIPMPVKLTFLGATQNVTGFRYLLETGSMKILIDCGLYRERDFLHRNWEEFSPEPSSIDAVFLTHAHLDHCGLLPRLVKKGFNKPIYCTRPTAEIAAISLLDAAKMQEEDAAFKKKRHEREGRKGPHPEMPLYTSDDAKATIPLFSPVDYGERVQLGPDLSATLYNAGHVLGSAMIKFVIGSGTDVETVIFSGDIGRGNDPILEQPALFDSADCVVMESTYGGLLHGTEEQAAHQLVQAIYHAIKAGGNVVIPSYVFERAQDMLNYINRFFLEQKIPPLPVFLDSPLAVDITDVFSRHPEYLNQNVREMIAAGHSPFEFPQLTRVVNAEQSKAIADVKGSSIIIAGSGMATGGPIKHHLINNITSPENSIIFVGYQAPNTLGRRIADGDKEVRILGQNYPVRAHIEKIDGFSAHADNDELIKWLSAFKLPPKRLMILNSEPATAQQFEHLVAQKLGWQVEIPDYGHQYTL